MSFQMLDFGFLGQLETKTSRHQAERCLETFGTFNKLPNL